MTPLIAGSLLLLLVGNGIVLRIAFGRKPEDLGKVTGGWVRAWRKKDAGIR